MSLKKVRIFNRGGTAIAAQWSTDSGAWIEIGEVTGRGSSDGGEVHGVVYDHVMPVEIETAHGVVTLQLGYNDLENPFVAAQRFIDQNELDQNYLSQIADFISSRAGKSHAPTFDMSDPAPSSSSSSYPMEIEETVSDSNLNKRQRHNYTFIPLQVYFSYEDIPSGLQSKVMTKLRDFNSSFNASSGGGKGTLTESELNVLDGTLGVLSDTSHYHTSRLHQNTCGVIDTMLSNWTDPKTLFPSFDILRMISAHPNGSQQLATSPYLPSILAKTTRVICQDFLGEQSELSSECSPASTPQALTALRFLVTTCRHANLRQKVLRLLLNPHSGGELCDLIKNFGCLSSTSKIKNVHRHAVTSFCANIVLAFCLGEEVLTSSVTRSEVLNAYYPTIVFLLENEPDNADVIMRCLISLGSVALSSSIPEELKNELKAESGVDNVLMRVEERWNGKSPDLIDNCLAEVVSVLN